MFIYVRVDSLFFFSFWNLPRKLKIFVWVTVILCVCTNGVSNGGDADGKLWPWRTCCLIALELNYNRNQQQQLKPKIFLKCHFIESKLQKWQMTLTFEFFFLNLTQNVVAIAWHRSLVCRFAQLKQMYICTYVSGTPRHALFFSKKNRVHLKKNFISQDYIKKKNRLNAGFFLFRIKN